MSPRRNIARSCGFPFSPITKCTGDNTPAMTNDRNFPADTPSARKTSFLVNINASDFTPTPFLRSSSLRSMWSILSEPSR
jgi:hypothetical protein